MSSKVDTRQINHEGQTLRDVLAGIGGSVGQTVFATRDVAAAANVNILVTALQTLGRFGIGDGGAAKYTRSASQPTVPGWFQSADGAYWAYASEVSNLRAHGARGDAVPDAVTGAWTGTDDTAAAQAWEVCAKTLGIPRCAPRGSYIINSRITADDGGGFQHSSNVHVYGEGDETVFVDRIVDGSKSLWAYQGSGNDGTTTTTCYLTAAANAGDVQITVNDSSLLKPDMWVTLIDHSQPVNGLLTGAKVANVGQAARVRTIDDATHVTLYGQIEFALTANAGSPISATTIRRFTAPASNLRWEKFKIVLDPTLAYTTTDRLFGLSRAVGVTWQNLHVVMPNELAQVYEYNLQDVIDFQADDCSTERKYTDADGASYTWQCQSSHHGTINNHVMFGGRHLSDGASTSIDNIEASHITFNNQQSYGLAWAPIQTHPGMRHVTWNNPVASGAGHNDADGAATPGLCAIQMRGRYCTVNNPKVTGFPTGVYFVEGQFNRILGGHFDHCDVGVKTARNQVDPYMDGAIFESIRHTVLSIDTDPTSSKLIFKNMTVIGTPSEEVVKVTRGWPTNPAQWTLDIRAPDAATLFTGVPANYNWHGLGTVAAGTVTPDAFQGSRWFYTNNGAHTLAPSANYGSYVLDITNAAAAGAITTSGWGKVTGDAFTTTNGHTFRCTATIGPAGSSLNVVAL